MSEETYTSGSEREQELTNALRALASSFDRLLTIAKSQDVLSDEAYASFVARSAMAHNALALAPVVEEQR